MGTLVDSDTLAEEFMEANQSKAGEIPSQHSFQLAIPFVRCATKDVRQQQHHSNASTKE